jgi:hypothetical protein
MPKLPPPRLIACALLLLSLAPATAARAQGVTPYDTYRDAYGDPHYTANLTPLPDDRTLLGPSVALSDPCAPAPPAATARSKTSPPASGNPKPTELRATGFSYRRADRPNEVSGNTDEHGYLWMIMDS